MKLSVVSLLLATVFSVHGVRSIPSSSWELPRFDYGRLLQEFGNEVDPNNVSDNNNNSGNNDAKKILDSLQDVGIISITNAIPHLTKQRLYEAMTNCHLSSNGGTHGAAAKTTIYPDGTKKTTWAASISKSVSSPISNASAEEGGSSCAELTLAVEPVQSLVGQVVQNLMQLLEHALDQEFKQTLKQELDHKLSDSSRHVFQSMDGGYSWQDLVSQGEQLDHFHVYSKPSGDPNGPQNEVQTIDWHTDHGWALAFLPGVMMNKESHSFDHSPGLFIRLPDGHAHEVRFAPHDDLVLLLGDGIAHVNHALQALDPSSQIAFRPVPHALEMPADDDNLRLWYGRMMLFPSDAIHSTLHQSFGSIRSRLNSHATHLVPGHDHGNTNSLFSLGCSSPQATPRLLSEEAATCLQDQFWCWHKCYNHTDTVNPEACASDGSSLQCVHSDDSSTLWDGETHNKAFAPGCVAVSDAGENTGGDTGSDEGGAEGGDEEPNIFPDNGNSSRSFMSKWALCIMTTQLSLLYMYL